MRLRRGRRRRRPYWQSAANLIAGALALVVFLASVGGFVVVEWFDGSIARVHLSLGPDRPAEAVTGSENWLLVGTDNGRSNVPGTRSDTTILTHLDSNGTTTNVSFPRDTLVTIPEYTDKKGAHPSHKAKFNEAILDGGPSLLIRTVEALTQIRIDHYISVDLAGFKKISQAIDGVKVCILHSDAAPEVSTEDGITHSSTNIDDSYSGFRGQDGEQTVVGDQALAFVRQRHGLPGGDLARIKRQQQFLGSVFRQATASNVLFNPLRVTRLIAAIKGALTLDEDTSLTDLEKLGLRLRGLDPSKVSFETLPDRDLEATDTDLGDVFKDKDGYLELIPSGQTDSVGAAQIVRQPDFDVMLAALKDEDVSRTPDAVSTAPSTEIRPVTVPASQVLVTVQNGIGRTGLADTVTAALAKDGFQTGAPGPADSTTHAASQVRYGPDGADSAQTVAAAIPGSVLVKDPSVTRGIVLVLGANYTRVDQVVLAADSPTQAPTTAPAPSASASPTPPPVTAANNRCTL